MKTSQYYGGAIWTNHALERLYQRNLPQDVALQAFQHPDESIPGKNPGTIEYRKHYRNSLITIIAKQNEKREWIILSTWIDPPLPGSIDIKKQEEWQRLKHATGWKKIFLIIKKQLGM